MAKIEDALDALRKWVKEQKLSYGEIEAKIIVHNSVVTDIYLNPTKVTTHLRVNEVISDKESNEEEKTKSHF